VRVKLDENPPDSVLSILGGVGHAVDTARAEGLRGAKDPAVWQVRPLTADCC
jgi:hypothetical protein